MARILPALAGVAACLAATGLTGCSLRDVKDETVVLRDVRDAVVLSGTTSRPAADGQKLRKGDRLQTGSAGAATLVVRDRRVLVGSATDVSVPDGANVVLGRGSLLVDRRRGPGVTVRVGDTTVDRVGVGALRVSRSLSVAVAALSTGVRVRTASGPRLALPALYQVGVAGRALPQTAAPLQLRDDAWERGVVPELVADDVRLNEIAAGLDGPDAPTIPAGYRPVTSGRVSDRLLAAAIGRAAGRDDATRRATALRTAGASWGVVAALVRTRAVAVGTALADLLHGVPTTTTPSASPSPGHVVAGHSPSPLTPTPTPRPTRTSTGGTPPPPPPSSPTASPSSSSIVDTIGKLIPTPTPTLGIHLP